METDSKASFSYWLERLSASAITWNVAVTFLRAGAAVLILPLLVRKLSPEHLGLWYVFGSFGMLGSLMDLGFSSGVSRAAAYLWAGAQKLVSIGVGPFTGNRKSFEPNYSLLADLVNTMAFYYRLVGILIFLVISLSGGAWIWLKTANMADARYLRICWIIYAIGIFFSFTSSLWLALLSGANHLRQSQQILAISLLINYVVVIGGLLFNRDILALVLGNLVMSIFLRSAGELAVRRGLNMTTFLKTARRDFSLLKTLWPNAWRTGLSSVGLYLTFSAGTLVCSAFLDLRTTASYGLSLQLALLIVQVSSAWFLMILPAVMKKRATGDTEILGLIVSPIQAYIFLYISGAIGVLLLGPVFLQYVLHAKAELLPRYALLLMLVVIGLEGHHALYRELVMTNNQNPFVKAILVSGILIVLCGSLLSWFLGVYGLLLAHGIVQVCFNNWWIPLQGIRSLRLTPGEYWAYFSRLSCKVPFTSQLSAKQ